MQSLNELFELGNDKQCGHEAIDYKDDWEL